MRNKVTIATFWNAVISLMLAVIFQGIFNNNEMARFLCINFWISFSIFLILCNIPYTK